MNYPTYHITQEDHDLVEAQIQEQIAKSNSYLKPHPSLGLGALAELQTVAWLKDIGANPKWNCGLWDRDITAGNIALDVKHTCTHFYPFAEGSLSVKESSLGNQFDSLMVFVWLKKDQDQPKVHQSVYTAYLLGWLFPDEVMQCGKVNAGHTWRDGSVMTYDSYRVEVQQMRPMEQLATVLVP